MVLVISKSGVSNDDEFGDFQSMRLTEEAHAVTALALSQDESQLIVGSANGMFVRMSIEPSTQFGDSR